MPILFWGIFIVFGLPIIFILLRPILIMLVGLAVIVTIWSFFVTPEQKEDHVNTRLVFVLKEPTTEYYSNGDKVWDNRIHTRLVKLCDTDDHVFHNVSCVIAHRGYFKPTLYTDNFNTPFLDKGR